MSERLERLRERERKIRAQVRAEERRLKQATIDAGHALGLKLIDEVQAADLAQVKELERLLFETGRAEVLREELARFRNTPGAERSTDVFPDSLADEDAEAHKVGNTEV